MIYCLWITSTIETNVSSKELLLQLVVGPDLCYKSTAQTTFPIRASLHRLFFWSLGGSFYRLSSSSECDGVGAKGIHNTVPKTPGQFSVMVLTCKNHRAREVSSARRRCTQGSKLFHVSWGEKSRIIEVGSADVMDSDYTKHLVCFVILQG